jgi:hypothetical protein
MEQTRLKLTIQSQMGKTTVKFATHSKDQLSDIINRV